jgi:hypothetical protein
LATSELAGSPNTLTIYIFGHLGRWADHLQAAMPGMIEELSWRLTTGKQVWKNSHNRSQMVYGELGNIVGSAILGNFVHESRHLRMMESLMGLVSGADSTTV